MRPLCWCGSLPSGPKIEPVLVNGPHADGSPLRITTTTVQRVESAKKVKSAAVQGSLEATRFDNRLAPGFNMEIDRERMGRSWVSCNPLIEGFHESLISQALLTGLRTVDHTRAFINVITPNAGGLTPDKWRKDATICPQHWPTDLSLLRGWYRSGPLEAFAKDAYTRLH